MEIQWTEIPAENLLFLLFLKEIGVFVLQNYLQKIFNYVSSTSTKSYLCFNVNVKTSYCGAAV